MDDLLVAYAGDAVERGRLRLADGWLRRWVGTWLVGRAEVSWPLAEMASVPVLSSQPVRRFTWRSRQGHRPGLQFMVSTGRHHGFESLEEQRLLLALDFVGVLEVLPQPFELDFEHQGGRSRHVPDFLAVMPDGRIWLFDVRPEWLVKPEDRLKFAAAREAAAACGWGYSVVAGWQEHVLTGLDHLSSQRRPLPDRLGLEESCWRRRRCGSVSWWRRPGCRPSPARTRRICSGTGVWASIWAGRSATLRWSGLFAQAVCDAVVRPGGGHAGGAERRRVDGHRDRAAVRAADAGH
ncbi:hypothetical protein ACFQ2M_00095 [Kitasatospora saccharophila]|uniref:hypothetical protein n=1 Tax=Kitasatospora saccharophila TaxID=407973 RepID=UPI003627D58C